MRKKLRYDHLSIGLLRRFAIGLALSLFSFFIFPTDAHAQAQLLKDIEDLPEPMFNEYSELTHGGSRFYFISNNELWKSGGSTGNTVRLKKFQSLSSLTLVGTTLYFVADDGTSGLELWKSDGSNPGTVRVKDIVPGVGSSLPHNLTAVNGKLFFVATSSPYGRELWQSDGTESGTVIVKDILRVGGHSNPDNLTNVNGTLFFTANDGSRGYELWKSDGTSAGTVMVKDIRPASKVSSSPSALVNFNNTLFFTAIEDGFGAELWKSDGTESGTVRVKDIRSGSGSSGIENTIVVNNILFFTANDGTHGDELWKTDGTEAGTQLVKDLNPGGGGSNTTNPFSEPMADFTNINGVLFFVGARGYTSYIYRSDGTEAGTYAITVADGVNINAPEPEFTYLHGKVYFLNAPNDEYPEQRLWKMDISGENMESIAAFLIPEDYYSNYTQEMISFNNALFTNGRLSTDDVYSDLTGYTLIRSNGTAEGTEVLKDAFTSTWGSHPRAMKSISTHVFMRTSGYLSDLEYLWVTDGTTAGTRQIAEMAYEFDWQVVGNTLYYTQYSTGPEGGWELWKSQGTPETTVKVSSQAGHSNEPMGMTDVNGVLYYHDINGVLWKTSGSAPVQVFDFEWVYSITNVLGTAFMIARQASTTGLWKTTASGVTKVSDVALYAYPSEQHTLAINNIFYFSFNDRDHGTEIWRSDGTASGTYMLADLNQSEDVGLDDIYSLGEYNNQLYVSSINNDNNWALFRVGPTGAYEELGTFEGPVDLMVEHNGRLVFFPFAEDGRRYHEAWTTDGTPAGTTLMTTVWLNFDQYWQMPIDYAVIGNTLFFGSEYASYLYKTDGYCVEQVETGVITAYGMEPLKNSLVFGAQSIYYGNEPYIYRNIPRGVTCSGETSVASRMDAPEAEATSVMTPHPNPFTNDFTMSIEGSDEEVAEVTVFSSSGMPVETFNNVKTNTAYTHIGGSWKQGIYIVKVNKRGVVTTQMIIKK